MTGIRPPSKGVLGAARNRCPVTAQRCQRIAPPARDEASWPGPLRPEKTRGVGQSPQRAAVQQSAQSSTPSGWRSNKIAPHRSQVRYPSDSQIPQSAAAMSPSQVLERPRSGPRATSPRTRGPHMARSPFPGPLACPMRDPKHTNCLGAPTESTGAAKPAPAVSGPALAVGAGPCFWGWCRRAPIKRRARDPQSRAA